MTHVLEIPGAVLTLGLVLALALWAIQLMFRASGVIPRPSFRGFLAGELGAVSVLYFVRGGNGVLINGSAAPPTAIQAAQVFKQSAQVIMGDTDTQALFTHNWGLDVSAPTYLEPEIMYYGQLLNAGGTYLTGFTFDVTNTNVVKCNKLNFLGTGGTFVVTLRRPQSVGQ